MSGLTGYRFLSWISYGRGKSGRDFQKVILYVKDVPQTAVFYRDILEMRVLMESPACILLMPQSGSQIELRQLEEDPSKPADAHEEIELVFEVADVDTVWEEWKTRAVTVPGSVQEKNGERFFLARDPGGHLLRITQVHSPDA